MRGRTTCSSQLSHSRPPPTPPPYSPRRRKAGAPAPTNDSPTRGPAPTGCGPQRRSPMPPARLAISLVLDGVKKTLDVPTCADCGRQGGRRGPSVRAQPDRPRRGHHRRPDRSQAGRPVIHWFALRAWRITLSANATATTAESNPARGASSGAPPALARAYSDQRGRRARLTPGSETATAQSAWRQVRHTDRVASARWRPASVSPR